MTDTTTTTLTVEQQQRAEAVRHARSALAGVNRRPEAEGILRLAAWIVDGNEPLVDLLADTAVKAAVPVAEAIMTIISNDRVQCTSTHQETSDGKTHRCLLPKGHFGMHHDPTSADTAKWVG
ncbi:hypothetical protein [Gordonia sp. (in: high G+C Gram-positive bacteria)]|uniref:hypothetical protein n=1 Tax=Gordonia sp. (in: high G+C Gram-positive bacteria) TaxID=84139 RepID=UPI00333E4790